MKHTDIPSSMNINMSNGMMRFDIIPQNVHIELMCIRPEDLLVATPDDINEAIFRIIGWSTNLPIPYHDGATHYNDEGTYESIQLKLNRAIEFAYNVRPYVDDLKLIRDVLRPKNIQRVYDEALALDAEDRSFVSDVRMSPIELEEWMRRTRLEQLKKFTTQELQAEISRRTGR